MQLVSIISVLLMGFGLSFIPALSIITGPIVGLTLVFLMIITKTTKLQPLLQGALVLFCSHNPLFTYFVLGTITASKMLIKASRTISSQAQVEGLEEGIIGNSIDDINSQWFIHWFWTTVVLLGGLISGTFFGLHVITGFGQLLLSVSLVASPFMWGLYICQLEKEEIPKFILGGIISCVLFLISLTLLFKGSMLGMLLPFVLLSNGVTSSINKRTEFKPRQISTDIWAFGLKKEVMWYVLASGIFRTLFIFFGGSLLVHMINKEYDSILSEEDKFINHTHSEAIGDAFQPIMLWGYLLSRGEMDSFSQLGLSYVLNRGEVFILILLMMGIQYLFFQMRGELITWLINEPPIEISIGGKGLDQLIVLVVSLILGTIILGSPIPILLMIGLTYIYTLLINHLKLPSLSQGMSITFIPIGLYAFG